MKSTVLLEGLQSTNIHMKMLFIVCFLNKQGHFFKVILVVIRSDFQRFFVGELNILKI